MNAPTPESDVAPSTPRLQFSLRTFFLVFVVLASSLAVFGAWGVAVFLAVSALALSVTSGLVAAGWAAAARALKTTEAQVYLMVLVLCSMCVIAWALLPRVESRPASRRSMCANNLREIALALQAYQQANGHFPPAYLADKNGKPMHSWRVLILPYLERKDIYDAYDFNEPWNGPKNRKLLACRPSQFFCPSDDDAGSTSSTQTNYLAVVGPNAMWRDAKPRTLDEFQGKTRRTVMLVEVANSGVAWTEPRDLTNDDAPGLRASSNHGRPDNFFYTRDYCDAWVAMADGSLNYLPLGSITAENSREFFKIGAFRENDFPDSDKAVLYLNWPNILALAVWIISVGVLLAKAARSRMT
jgi:hypothetical protein